MRDAFNSAQTLEISAALFLSQFDLPRQDEVTLASGSLRWGCLVLAALAGARGGSLRGSLRQNSRWVTSAAVVMQSVT